MAIENWKLFANTVILDVGSELVADDKITLTRNYGKTEYPHFRRI